MNRNAIIALVVIALAVVAFVVFGNQSNNENGTTNPSPTPPPSPVTNTPTPNPSPVSPNPTSPNPTTPNPPATPTPSPNPSTPRTHDVSMTDTGYSPSTLTVKKGDTVKFTNNGTRSNWPASAPHPTHTDYPAFDPKQGIAPGSSWSFTFDRVGTWRYHDHLNPSRFGSITVQE